MVNALEYLKSLPFLPVALKRGEGKEIYGRPSNSELSRWLNMGTVRINGKTPKTLEEISYPIWELIFFPKGKRRTTMVNDYHPDRF